MYLTEEDARRKWCPQGRSFVSIGKMVGQYNIGPINIVSINGQETKTYCIASECMMWPKCNQGWHNYEGPGGKP